MKEGLPHTRPQPQVIIPSAAYGGAIISFVLCPSELVKVSLISNPLSHCCLLVFHTIFVTLNFSSVGCKFKGPILWFQNPVDTVVLLIVPLKP